MGVGQTDMVWMVVGEQRLEAGRALGGRAEGAGWGAGRGWLSWRSWSLVAPQ